MLVIYPYPEPDQSSTCHHPTSWRTILIVSSHLRLGLPSSLFPSGFSTKTRYAHLLTPYVLHAQISYSFRFDKPKNIWPGKQISQLLIMYFSPLPCYLVPHRPRYSLQHCILQHPQPTFLSQCERPSFTPIQDSEQKDNPVYLNVDNFG